VTDEQQDTATTEAPPAARDPELRPHPQATHWALSRWENERWERMPFRVSEAGEAINIEAVDKFSAIFVRDKFGFGRYRVNWRQLPAGSRKSFTLGYDELTLVPPTTMNQGGAAPVPSVQTMTTCLACGAEFLGRFCGSCGAPAGTRVGATTSAPSTELYERGVQFATAAMDRTAAIARAEAEERIKRYEIDVKATLERERMAHEKAIKEQAAWFERVNAGPKFDPNALAEKFGALLKEELSGFEARLEEIEARLDEDDEPDDDDDNAQPTTPQAAPTTDEGKTWNDRIEVAGKFVDKVGAPIVNAIGDAVERIRKGANGAASNAQSSEPT
jgi:hypothetical protein